MNLQQFQNVLILAQKLHFTQAAQEANIVQPALSRQVRVLEEELGVTLFKRHKRKVELTQAGKYFTGEIKKVMINLERINEKAKVIQSEGAGELRIGFTYSVMQSILPEILQIIKDLRPGMRTSLKDDNNPGQFEALQNRQLDIGFVTNPVIPKNLKGKTLRTDPFVICLPPDHSVTQKNYKDFSVFSDEDFIFPPISGVYSGTNYINDLTSICIDAGFYPRITHTTHSSSTAFKLVEEGMGVYIEPRRSLQNQDWNLTKIILVDIPQKADLTMVWNNDFEEEYPELLEVLKNGDFTN